MTERVSLKSQIQNRFSLLIFLSILIVGSAFTFYMSRVLTRDSVEYNQEIVSVIQRELDLYFLRILDLMNVASENDLIRSVSVRAKTGYAWRAVDFLQNLIIDHPEVKDIILLNKAGFAVVSTGAPVTQWYNFYQQPWFYSKVSALGKALFLDPHGEEYYVEGGGEREVVSFVLSLGGEENEDLLGGGAALLCNINISELQNISTGLSRIKNSTLAIYTASGESLFPDTPDFDRDGSRRITVHSLSELSGWQVAMHLPREAIWKDLEIALYLFTLGIIAALSAALYIASRISRAISRPVEIMAYRMGEIGKGNYSLTLEEEEGALELGKLGHSIDSMVRQILVFQERIREAQLMALQEQVNPHFLFNTLQTIKSLTIDDRGADIRDITGRLSELLRFGLYSPWELVPLEKELEMVENYLKIQELRFPGAFRFSSGIPDSLSNTPILKLLLQPLVENSLLHALVPDRILEITISAYSELGATVLVLSDNGRGIPDGRLEELQAALNYRSGQGESQIGLKNVAERMFLKFGSDYRMRINSEEGRGCRIILTLPQGTVSSGRRPGEEL